MMEEMEKLRVVGEMGLHDTLFPESRAKSQCLRNSGSVESHPRLRAHPKAYRLTLWRCWLRRAQEITMARRVSFRLSKKSMFALKRGEEEYANEFKRIANNRGYSISHCRSVRSHT